LQHQFGGSVGERAHHFDLGFELRQTEMNDWLSRLGRPMALRLKVSAMASSIMRSLASNAISA